MGSLFYPWCFIQDGVQNSRWRIQDGGPHDLMSRELPVAPRPLPVSVNVLSNGPSNVQNKGDNSRNNGRRPWNKVFSERKFNFLFNFLVFLSNIVCIIFKIYIFCPSNGPSNHFWIEITVVDREIKYFLKGNDIFYSFWLF